MNLLQTIKTHGILETLARLAMSALAYLYAACTPRTAETEQIRCELRRMWK